MKGAKTPMAYRVDNAILLAAGFSSRFVPLSFERPKPLLPVKGEPLLERQIRQLREAGVGRIVVVTGYLAEQFAPLARRYDVTLFPLRRQALAGQLLRLSRRPVF